MPKAFIVYPKEAEDGTHTPDNLVHDRRLQLQTGESEANFKQYFLTSLGTQKSVISPGGLSLDKPYLCSFPHHLLA